MRRTILFAAAGLAVAVSTLLAGSGRPDAQFHLRVTYISAVPGDVMTYTATPGMVVVTYDDSGGKRRELLRSKMTRKQARRLHARMKSLPLDSLRPESGRDDVDDGFEIHFRIQIDNRPEKRITMHNAWQPDLRRLCIELNLLLPEALRINVPLEVGAFQFLLITE